MSQTTTRKSRIRSILQVSPRVRMSYLSCAILLALAQPAHAGFTVMDDDLFPTQAIPASVAAAAKAQAHLAQSARQSSLITQAFATSNISPNTNDGENFTILFRKNIWGLNEEGIAAVTELMPILKGKKVVITGRPDGLPNAFLAENRANALRALLIKNGVPEARITVRMKDVPTVPVNNQYPVDIQIIGASVSQASLSPQPAVVPTRPSPVLAQLTATASNTTFDNGIRTTITPFLQTAAPTSTVAIIATPQPAISLDSRIDTIRQIASASLAGRIDAKAAIATIHELLLNHQQQPALGLAAPQAVAPAPKPAPGAEFGLVASAETARPKEWSLTSEKTLKDNTSEWAKKEGFSVEWKAENYFKVGRNSTVTGDLLDAIDRVTTAANLDMNVWKKDRLICISDKGTDKCKRP